MGWACEACDHAPHGENHGRGCLREDGNGICGCTFVTDRSERARNIASAHAAPERNTDYAKNAQSMNGDGD